MIRIHLRSSSMLYSGYVSFRNRIRVNQTSAVALSPAGPPATALMTPEPSAPVIAPAAPSSRVAPEPLAQRLGMRFLIVLVFLHFSFLHEILGYVLRSPKTLILLFTNVGTIALILASGTLGKAMRSHVSRWWFAFLFWFMLSVPFSFWKGESLRFLGSFLFNVLPMLIAVAALVSTLKDCFHIMYAVACGAFVNLLSSNLFRPDDLTGRLSLQLGSIGNSNDFAAHLLYVLPFLMFLAWVSNFKILKAACFLGIVFGLYLIENTGSRGALLACLVVLAFIFLRASGSIRIAFAILAPAMLLFLALLLPKSLLLRYATLWSNEAAATQVGATESYENRSYLLRTSLRFTAEHPLFGVGPGEFADVEGSEARAQGRHGSWLVSHNSYTEISSEMGFPGAICFVGALVSTMLLLNRNYRRASQSERLKKLRAASFCLMISFTGFAVAIFFLSLAYTFYMPFMSGLAIAISRVIDRELAGTASAPRLRTA